MIHQAVRQQPSDCQVFLLEGGVVDVEVVAIEDLELGAGGDPASTTWCSSTSIIPVEQQGPTTQQDEGMLGVYMTDSMSPRRTHLVRP